MSEHEYARLRTLSSTLGAHSLADFVRSLLAWAIDNPPQGLAEPADVPALAWGALMPHGVRGRSVYGQDAQVYETMLELVRALQWKAESANQELSELAALLAPPQGGLRAIAAARVQVPEMLHGPARVKAEPDPGRGAHTSVTRQP